MEGHQGIGVGRLDQASECEVGEGPWDGTGVGGGEDLEGKRLIGGESSRVVARCFSFVLFSLDENGSFKAGKECLPV